MELPEEFTAVNSKFPQFLPSDAGCICFNIREGDAAITPDPFFNWHGSYVEMLHNGQPEDALWQAHLKEVASEEGIARVAQFCKSLHTADRPFYSPGKAKRWGKQMLGPDGTRPTTREQVLVRSRDARGAVTWILYELSVDSDAVEEYILNDRLLRRLTYPSFLLISSSAKTAACPPLYDRDVSEPAWLDGSTLIRMAAWSAAGDRVLHALPDGFAAIRYVPLREREAFLRSVASKPTCAMTGATLDKGNENASLYSMEVAHAVGKAVAAAVGVRGVDLMASASMRAHRAAMSADHDLTSGFHSVDGCKAVHFKGSNSVRLHGDAWRMDHGVTYLIEEQDGDFTNHAKEAALMACSTNEGSFALCANGGPTVACNVVRFLTLCRPGRVFAISGMHGASGMSGAAASFSLKREQLVSFLESLISLAPAFFGEKVRTDPDEIVASLSISNLRVLEIENERASGKTCFERIHTVKVESPNTARSPGFTAADAGFIDEYAADVARKVAASYEEFEVQRVQRCSLSQAFTLLKFW
eukprot:TRINITY_DN15957_c0_g5_i1.p1 TRINITY_DN15957_c0_g5~~TRINITY_DN15957_c0_g5_i1.p1  ORF type:complete len:530 (+),score=85.19 TRINITY_DN15957_c0_g5_i1:62-1651(+)